MIWEIRLICDLGDMEATGGRRNKGIYVKYEADGTYRNYGDNRGWNRLQDIRGRVRV